MAKIKINQISFFVLFLLIVFPYSKVYAATIGFSPSSGSYNIGDTINVKVNIGTGSSSVNAVSASISFPSDILFLSSISKTGSIINLWAQEPTFSNSDGIASFEGVILNGYVGNAGTAVTLIFRVKNEGEALLRFNTASVLANDGNATEVLYSKGIGNLSITKAESKPTVSKKESSKDVTIQISEIKNDISRYSPNKFLITSRQPVADKSYSIQIDEMNPIIWTDDGTHVYQAPVLENGAHIIKVMAVDVNSNTLSGFLTFSTTVLKAPEITYYPKELYTDEFLVLKGLADPSVEVELIITNIETNSITVNHVSSNGDGEFTYVSNDYLTKGKYSISARSKINDTTSDYMDIIQIESREHGVKFFISRFSNYLIVIIPLIALFGFATIVLLYFIYRVKKSHILFKKKLLETQDIVSKNFNMLDKDIVKEKTVSEKFKEDVRKVEKSIKKIIENIES